MSLQIRLDRIRAERRIRDRNATITTVLLAAIIIGLLVLAYVPVIATP